MPTRSATLTPSVPTRASAAASSSGITTTPSGANVFRQVHFDWTPPTATFLNNEWSLLEAGPNRPPAEEGRNWPLLPRKPKHWAETVNVLDNQQMLYGQLRSLLAYCEAHNWYPAPMMDLMDNVRALPPSAHLLEKCKALEREVAIDVVARSAQSNPVDTLKKDMDTEFCRKQYIAYKDRLETDRQKGGYDYLTAEATAEWATCAAAAIQDNFRLLRPVQDTSKGPFRHRVSAFGCVQKQDNETQTEDIPAAISGAPLPPPSWTMTAAIATPAAAIATPAPAAIATPAAAAAATGDDEDTAQTHVSTLSQVLANFPATSLPSATATAAATAPAVAAAATDGDTSDDDYQHFLANAVNPYGHSSASAAATSTTAAATSTPATGPGPWANYRGQNTAPPPAPVVSREIGGHFGLQVPRALSRATHADPSHRRDPAILESLLVPVVRGPLTADEAIALQNKLATHGPRDIHLDNADIEGYEVPAGTDLNTVSVWRLPVGFYYLHWTITTGIERIPGHFDEYAAFKLRKHRMNNEVNAQGPVYTEPTDDPIEDTRGHKHGGWRIKVLDLPTWITPQAIVDLLRLDIAALSEDPGHYKVPASAFRGEITVRAPPSGTMRSAFVTANSEDWANAFLTLCFCGSSRTPLRALPIT